ncbi:FtsX-like permease family protein [Pradoshia sp.]
MHRLVKKWRIENLLILFFFIATFVVFFLTMLNAQKQEMINFFTNDMSEMNSITFFTNDNERIRLKEMSEQIDKPFLLLKREIDSTKRIHAVLNKGLDSFLPVKEGRSFERKDYFHQKRVAVIGKDYYDIRRINGSRYIEVDGNLFKVIGILDSPVESEVDKEAFINLDAYEELNSEQNSLPYILNGRVQTEEIFREIDKINNDLSISTIEVGNKGTGRISSVSSIPIYILLMGSVLGIQSLLILFWIHRKQRFIAVHQLIGHSTHLIRKQIFLQYGKLFLIGGVIGCLCSLVLDPQSELIRDGKYVSYIVIFFLLYTLLNICLLAVAFYKTSNKETLKVLNES